MPASAAITEAGDPAPLAPKRRFGRSPRLLLLLIVCLAVVGAVVFALVDGFGNSPSSNSGLVDNWFPTSVASVRRESLSSQTEVSATLGYAGASTIVAPAGTAPSAVLEAQQQVTGDQGMLQAAQATLASDTQTLAQLRTDLSALQAKERIDCAGNAAAESASTGGAGTGAGPCASDEQSVASDEQGLSGDETKVASDQSQFRRPRAASAEHRRASRQRSLRGRSTVRARPTPRCRPSAHSSRAANACTGSATSRSS